MSPNNTPQGRRCKRRLTKSRNPRIAFDWSSTRSRHWSGALEGWARAVHPDDLASLSNMWHEIRNSGARGETEGRLQRFDGKYRWFLLRVEPLRDEVGNIVK